MRLHVFRHQPKNKLNEIITEYYISSGNIARIIFDHKFSFTFLYCLILISFENAFLNFVHISIELFRLIAKINFS